MAYLPLHLRERPHSGISGQAVQMMADHVRFSGRGGLVVTDTANTLVAHRDVALGVLIRRIE